MNVRALRLLGRLSAVTGCWLHCTSVIGCRKQVKSAQVAPPYGYRTISLVLAKIILYVDTFTQVVLLR